ncbi:DUF4160 domain-containing protein [Synechococcus sp. CS-602]|uniref:DUF4160 domain-containing protein n=1 Tax=unclassified Synechococcus TaxID=2626047 RepID=UPI0008FF3B05|nr:MULTISPECIES: DUF4160 domain-containing protein [unclassified Synechococcus]MCT0203021.1 DUF4160 domain-containing protein [Synechococcus sp. CS-603]MCT0204660.1 DUF4160 domain-containing protein [Synechococcus sp. CS-602]MCT0245281.1 DUF4160 domain-containing protein [Synechococcus sp. CS-601]MCT4365055.1 DUF4160 domain-containing protein [Candidatus Regnicoccus frigidus MAG-AL1]
MLRRGPYRFYLYSHEPQEPLYSHVDQDRGSCKVWLGPVALCSSLGFWPMELRDIAGMKAKENYKIDITLT